MADHHEPPNEGGDDGGGGAPPAPPPPPPPPVDFKDQQWLNENPLNRNSVFEYFALSPFYQSPCNNEQFRRADLIKAEKKYLKQKVCKMHYEASSALVGKVMQRFCMLCKRFHELQEFDKDRRCCQRSLANLKKRRKTQPYRVENETSLHGDKDVNALLAHGVQGLPISKHPAAEMSQRMLHSSDVQLEDLPASSSQGLSLKIPIQGNTVSYIQGNENPAERNNLKLACPPQTSGNSDSASAQAPSSSTGNARILDWLSHRPIGIESYIRPGCIVLTIYLHITESAWEELSRNLGSSLSHIVVETSLPSKSSYYSTILNVKPIAVPLSERAEFRITGFNLTRLSTRILCAQRGNYTVLEDNNLEQHTASIKEHDEELQHLNFACSSIPLVPGRGFPEVDDDDLGLGSSSSFPFIVAETDVCSEIHILESEMESTDETE
ncbi:hypothetical protein ACH5RR_007986 [Cinchona calisaya]|uniref:SBP-type domain-containing protein n=1 Tax=Cinchona calisaya TaxID=153742 RepID=A0ABD3ABU4_9GENT